MANDVLNFELELTAKNGATAIFQFHGDNWDLADDHATTLLKDVNRPEGDVNRMLTDLEWSKAPEGKIKGRFRRIGAERWSTLYYKDTSYTLRTKDMVFTFEASTGVTYTVTYAPTPKDSQAFFVTVKDSFGTQLGRYNQAFTNHWVNESDARDILIHAIDNF